MSIPFQIGGARTVIPGVYDTFRVQNSLPAPVPAGRSVLIMGEAEEGVPGAELDLRLNFFTSFQDVRDFYKSGDIVDAARMLFSNQPSPIFAGAIQRLYVYKTNNSTRAERPLEGPTGYGDLVAARFGEDGNLIKTQVVDAQTETLPTKTFNYFPNAAGGTYTVMGNGKKFTGSAVPANGNTFDFVISMAGSAAAGVLFQNGFAKSDITGGTMDVTLSATDDDLTFTKTAGAGVFATGVSGLEVGDTAYIPILTAAAGASDENAGAYTVKSASATELVLTQVKHQSGGSEANVEAFDTTAISGFATGDILFHAPVLMTTLPFGASTGACSSVELLEASASEVGAGDLSDPSTFNNLLLNSTSSVASIVATSDFGLNLTVDLSTGAWSSTPKVGDLVKIGRGSLLAGATNKNVGTYIVKSSSSQSITMAHIYSGFLTTESVASADLNGANDTLTWAAGFISTSTAARRCDSSAERKVKVEASRESDGESVPDSSIGGNCVLEIGYYDVAATACTVTIDAQRKMTITPTGSGLNPITVLLNKYSSLGELTTYLNAQANISAKVPVPQNRSLPTSVIDQVSGADILDGHANPSYNGRFKKDYYDWNQFFANNFSLLAFRAGGLNQKAGLPDAEANPTFLSGATLGWTTNANVQNAHDAGLKVEVRQVIPLFSRDASKDILDGETDPNSSYTIDAIHAANKAHVSTASSTLFKKERFGMISFDGSFEDSKNKVGEIAFERCQMTFQRNGATDGEGELKTFLPWMSACAIAAARSQAILGTSMLRKPFLLSSAEHVGDLSLFTDTLEQDFEPDDRGELEEAIEAGLVVFRSVPGFGVRMESPDLSTRSRDNDPQAWVWERVNVLFTADEVRQTVRSVLENFIGERQSDVPVAVVRQAMEDTIKTFLVGSGNGSLLSGRVTSLVRVGNTYKAEMSIQPVEAIEAITVDVLATRDAA